MDTIYALSSGRVPSGVAVIRISGPQAGPALAALAGGLPVPRRAELRNIRRPSDTLLLDRGLVLWFPAPCSETGEDLAELQVHGGAAIIRGIFDSLAEQNLRLARPGEFNRRAFLNGKLDLTEVEGLADLIAAETEMQLRQAIGQARGDLFSRAGEWQRALTDLRAEIEARLDFSDEGDVPEALAARFWVDIATLREDMAAALAGAESGARMREGFRVAILGRPNAGKSSLLNALARRDVAIVTEEAGTTRDVLEVPLDLGGYPVLLFDTAGLREAASTAEREGVRRARLTAERADLILWLDDCTAPADALPPMPAAPVWRISTKIDLDPGAAGSELAVSVTTGEGLESLIRRIESAAQSSLGGTVALVTRQRQKETIEAALATLHEVDGAAAEIAADLLRAASDAIGRLVGRVDVEDVLDRLFGEFCVGK